MQAVAELIKLMVELRLNLNSTCRLSPFATPTELARMDFTPANCSGSPRPLCHCLGIPAEEVRTVIEEHALSTVRGVTKVCGAGGGCTACHRHIKRMLHEHAAPARITAEAPKLEFA